MAGETSIEWTDATWNPTRGCSCVSPGCTKCYAMKIAARFSGKGMAYEGLAKMHPKAGGQWTGKVRLVEEQLDAPLRWSKPRRIFVNSMSDLFHEALSIEQIAEVFAVMALAPRHTFQILTKRAERMRSVLNGAFNTKVREAIDQIIATTGRAGLVGPVLDLQRHPLSNVWLGVSVENQQCADERIPALLATPAAVRFLSCEPLLEGLRLMQWLRRDRAELGPGIDWVIVGGESGAQPRRFEVGWARSIVNQCRRTGARPFVKQFGAFVVDRNDAGFEAENDVWAEGPDAGKPTRPESWPSPHGGIEENLDGYRDDYQGAPVRVHLRDRAGGDMAEWPLDLRVREFPEVSR